MPWMWMQVDTVAWVALEKQQLIKAWWWSIYRLYRHMLINSTQQL